MPLQRIGPKPPPTTKPHRIMQATYLAGLLGATALGVTMAYLFEGV